MKIQSENIAFSNDEMLNCPKCGKSNPPNRASCLYCSAVIVVPEGRQGSVKLNLRKLEGWENGFNVVLLSRTGNTNAEAASRYLKIELDVFERMLASHDPFPVARIESEAEAELAVKQLASFGILSIVVRDIELKIGKPNIRLRSVEFLDDRVRLTAFNTSEQRVVHGREIALIVVGRIFESKMESVERGKKDKRKVMAESISSSDELLVDIYTRESEQGFRVTTRGFDFSTLGKGKSLLAVENMQLLLDGLKAFAREAKIADEYPDLVNQLSEVWDVERRKDFEGLKRTGVWKAGFSSVARTSNLEQFTKYSRLQRILL